VHDTGDMRRASAAAQLVTLWIGPELTFLERACLRSVIRHNHSVALYCYEPPAGVPDEVELRDARAILPEGSIIRHRDGSPSLFSNRFRYELQRQAMGVWIDCDLYFVAPLGEQPDCIMGDQGGGTINGAILRLPPDCPMLDALLALFEERSAPAWLSWRARILARWRLLTQGRAGLSRMPWGSAGPEALTWLATSAGWAHKAQPPARFYPVPWTEADWIVDPDRPLDAMIEADTIAVHLWNERLRGLDLAGAPPGSFAARLREEGGQ